MSKKNSINIVWFRNDLRLSDNPALFEAAKHGPILPIYIVDDKSAGEFKMGGATKWWLYHSLTELNKNLHQKLNVYFGNTETIFKQLIKNYAIEAVYYNRQYEPFQIQIDKVIQALLDTHNINYYTFKAALLKEPWEMLKPDKQPYKVYTAFYKKFYTNLFNSEKISKPLAIPNLSKLTLEKDSHHKNTLDNLKLKLLGDYDWYTKMEPYWQIGEKNAQKKCIHFIKTGLLNYEQNRNYPSKPNTSKLSPHLHFGEISPLQIITILKQKTQDLSYARYQSDIICFMKELVWREFAYYLLYHFPHITRQNLRSEFNHFPWVKNPSVLTAWQKGQTGYPIIDAGMRELWQTGYMHNRVRMIVGSFLIKNLRLHWHEGEDWFWDCLVDADLANNSMNWQWVAGSGIDAAPYFRIFNPTTQAKEYASDGDYIRRFVPELKLLPNQYITNPAEAPFAILEQANITLGITYPKPIVDLKTSRDQALKAYKNLKNKL